MLRWVLHRFCWFSVGFRWFGVGFQGHVVGSDTRTRRALPARLLIVRLVKTNNMAANGAKKQQPQERGQQIAASRVKQIAVSSA